MIRYRLDIQTLADPVLNQLLYFLTIAANFNEGGVLFLAREAEGQQYPLDDSRNVCIAIALLMVGADPVAFAFDFDFHRCEFSCSERLP